MRQYEITYLISDDVPEGDLNKVTGKVGGFITDLGGKVIKEEIWGRRKLTYPIQKQEFATYITLLFNLEGDKIITFERSLKLYDKVIRHLLIIKDYGIDKISLVAEEIAETKEIAAVIGGERSFEAIVGETEESYDLHSKKKEEKEEVETEKAPEKTEKTKKESKIEEKVEETKEEVAEEIKEKESDTDKKEVKKVEKAEKKIKPKKEKTKTEEKAEKEAERLSKLDEELDQILGDDL